MQGYKGKTTQNSTGLYSRVRRTDPGVLFHQPVVSPLNSGLIQPKGAFILTTLHILLLPAWSSRPATPQDMWISLQSLVLWMWGGILFSICTIHRLCWLLGVAAKDTICSVVYCRWRYVFPQVEHASIDEWNTRGIDGGFQCELACQEWGDCVRSRRVYMCMFHLSSWWCNAEINEVMTRLLDHELLLIRQLLHIQVTRHLHFYVVPLDCFVSDMNPDKK